MCKCSSKVPKPKKEGEDKRKKEQKEEEKGTDGEKFKLMENVDVCFQVLWVWSKVSQFTEALKKNKKREREHRNTKWINHSLSKQISIYCQYVFLNTE